MSTGAWPRSRLMGVVRSRQRLKLTLLPLARLYTGWGRLSHIYWLVTVFFLDQVRVSPTNAVWRIPLRRQSYTSRCARRPTAVIRSILSHLEFCRWICLEQVGVPIDYEHDCSCGSKQLRSPGLVS